MISKVVLKNFGPLADLEWSDLGPLNLVIGQNGSGKTFLLKALYTAMRTMEGYRRGDDKRLAGDILFEKLYWTFQPDKLGDLVTKRRSGPLACEVGLRGKGSFSYRFGKNTSRKIGFLKEPVPKRNGNSIFLPAKEVLSLQHVILTSRERDSVFGFDDTYFDLVHALQHPATRGNNFRAFSEARKRLKKAFDGRVSYDASTKRWYFVQGSVKFDIGLTSEGIRKIGVLDTLLGNRYLTPHSIVFVDEPEAALHPTAISQLLDIVEMLSETGIQFFLASHSYFVVKKLALMAQAKKISIPVLSYHERRWHREDLRDGMVSNPIIDESIRLYEEEVGMVLK
ncbi:MAG: AAA family ATPase [Deltaproteobacteria bacterium]|nr:AAA family ATPase [Deltaproteobacteria bacterium]